MRDPAPLITEAHDRVRSMYGAAIGRDRHEVITPALVVDLDILKANLAYMQSRLPGLHARLRGHVKNHKSPHIGRLQLEYGAFGLCCATVWEAIVMVRAGADDVLIANQLVDPAKRRAAALLAREANILVNVDDIGDAQALSAAAVAAGSTIGVLLEVDTGMHRSGVDSPDEAVRVVAAIADLPGLRFDGLSGYEGHCSMEMDHEARHAKQQAAIDYFVSVADRLAAAGHPCRILSAAGTATAFWTGRRGRHPRLPADRGVRGPAAVPLRRGARHLRGGRHLPSQGGRCRGLPPGLHAVRGELLRRVSRRRGRDGRGHLADHAARSAPRRAPRRARGAHLSARVRPTTPTTRRS